MKKILLAFALTISTVIGLSQNKTTLPSSISVYIPNAFTPDGDGVNDVFIPSIVGHKSIDMYVYNRRGDVLSCTPDGWDGKYKGNVCPEGVYLYIIYITDEFDVRHTFVGPLTLVKLK